MDALSLYFLRCFKESDTDEGDCRYAMALRDMGYILCVADSKVRKRAKECKFVRIDRFVHDSEEITVYKTGMAWEGGI